MVGNEQGAATVEERLAALRPHQEAGAQVGAVAGAGAARSGPAFTTCLASVEIVTACPEAQGQALVSVLWALTGVAALVAALLRDAPEVRHAAPGLLAVTAGKFFLYDLSSLTPLARVGSLIGLGVLLPAGAYAWQRIRPRPMPDLRGVPDALR
jgi:uncharacterized membrane protein